MYSMNLPVYIKNVVIRGFGRGSRELGCPTANVDKIQHLDIPTGIYCGLVQLIIRHKHEVQEEPGNREEYEDILNRLPYVSPVEPMVCSFGYNPTYNNNEKSLEVHILNNYRFYFYGAELRVLICKKMRDEEKYNSLDELKQAIANDIRNAKREAQNYYEYSEDKRYFIDDATNLVSIT